MRRSGDIHSRTPGPVQIWFPRQGGEDLCRRRRKPTTRNAMPKPRSAARAARSGQVLGKVSESTTARASKTADSATSFKQVSACQTSGCITARLRSRHLCCLCLGALSQSLSVNGGTTTSPMQGVVLRRFVVPRATKCASIASHAPAQLNVVPQAREDDGRGSAASSRAAS